MSSSYLSQSVKKASYILNRQPLPRSLYQREFLYYGIVPTYSNNSRISVDPALKVSKASKFEEDKSPTCDRKLTVYQTEFKEKETRIMDSKELDCRVDKFRYFPFNAGMSISASCPSEEELVRRASSTCHMGSNSRRQEIRQSR